jgi:N6-L-threonylcarbamoyladenine synthase
MKCRNPNVKLTYGYITKNTRINNNLKKAHRIDAICISGNPTAKSLDYWYYIKQVRKHNRQIHKAKILKGGIRKLNQAPYEVKGFRLFDKVKYQGQECFIFGRRSSGYFDLRKLDGEVIHRSGNCKDLKLMERRKSLLFERRISVSSPDLKKLDIHAKFFHE